MFPSLITDKPTQYQGTLLILCPECIPPNIRSKCETFALEYSVLSYIIKGLNYQLFTQGSHVEVGLHKTVSPLIGCLSYTDLL